MSGVKDREIKRLRKMVIDFQERYSQSLNRIRELEGSATTMSLWDLVQDVQAHMKWDREKTLLWFDTANPLLGDVSPAHFYQLRPEKCTKFILSLIRETTPSSTPAELSLVEAIRTVTINEIVDHFYAQGFRGAEVASEIEREFLFGEEE